MISEILGILFSAVLAVISALGLAGVTGLMFLSSANIPMPSQVIMPFAGFVASEGRFTLFGVILAGVLGGFCGSLTSYFIGRKLGMRSIDFFSKISLHGKKDFLKTEKWFSRFGPWVVLVGLSLPIIRSFISLPAGIFGVRPKSFIPMSLISTSVWTTSLSVLGFVLGKNWTVIGEYFHKFDLLIFSLGIIFVIAWIFHHFRPSQIPPNGEEKDLIHPDL